MSPSLISVGFLIFPGFPMACLTSMVEPLRAANEISGERIFAWSLLSEQGGKVTASAEVNFDTSALMAAPETFDSIFLMSPPAARFARSGTPGHLRALARHGTRIGAISGGVFPMVRAGLGLGQKLAVHWCYRAAFDAAFPERAASDQVLEIGQGVVTAAGAAAAFDVALHLIEARLGAGIAAEVACWFQHPMLRRGDVAQVVPVGEVATALPPMVARAVALFSENLAEPRSVAEIAGSVGITPRHLERAFKQATGLGPSRYFRKLRMEAARQMVLYSNDPLARIAGAVGYGSTQGFARHYEAAFGMPPREDRKRINLYRVEGNLPLPSI